MNMRLDVIDRKMLAILQNEGRITITELAARLPLSVSRCQRRLRELEAAGVVTGYRATVDPTEVGLGFEVLVFATLGDLGELADFDKMLAALPQVVEAQRLFGDPDYLIRIVAPDLTVYQRLYDEHLTRLPGKPRMTSTIVMKHVVEARALPVHDKTDGRQD